uniref:Adenosine kinase n=1 Tax=Dunaliella tertiolecta TaxID=3047 RepID=A0A7S3QYE6_DUNTE|mmetsp:Transcript_16776/g.46238  ORF Transcript_16776/g.46238 Transcript_16776/m.46238 type:complete len:344 (+) Transcript_16776:70-1101(+)|eukprot:CAMPEP_0202346976 /NCGR_PEP_ID=MMETSP1126-20121109/5537_1 /ASSEMBLY_ACC=CAM_ASM_000457 /TAXON_ID=3047 /ORGANISM="Dunaliella tertiolecta, Strain CCMP1320" /LENGTH=343 /DNA_ID=CAMNT_0048938463 /DNA_START=275 /DNA_END=1306 /DNA_ORIENTATION=+
MCSEGSILCLGNPLLDVSANVDAAFLKKYDLQAANQILAEDKHLPMYQELAARPDVEYIAGGAGQNSVRVAQWMLQVPNATAYMGCVGADDFANRMTEQAKKDGVQVRYQVDPNTPTGKCAVCVTGIERSLVAHLAAANNFKADFAMKNWDLVEKARVVYMSGFFITVSPEAIMNVARHVAENDKILCMNLSAPFIMQVPPFKKTLMDAIPYMDFLFGNEAEAEEFAKSEGWPSNDLEQVALKISRMPKANGSRPRMVVFTHGAQPTIIACEGKVQLYPVNRIDPKAIVDTNGAGDAFVGGFLSQLVCGKPVSECVRAGNYAASVIIQRAGCTFPAKPSFVWN